LPFHPPYVLYRPDDLLCGLAGPRQELAEAFGLRQTDGYTIDQFDTFSDSRPFGAPKSGQRPAKVQASSSSSQTSTESNARASRSTVQRHLNSWHEYQEWLAEGNRIW